MRFLKTTCLSFLTVLAIAAPGVAFAWSDCMPDKVADFKPKSPATNGHDQMPGIALGLPEESVPNMGATYVVSLGTGGWITLEFTDNKIVDKPGADFIVFENAFFSGSVPGDSASPFCVFAEPLIVEVSEDGINWKTFPYDTAAVAALGDTTSSVRPFCGDTLMTFEGLAGITPTFTGNLIAPDRIDEWDPNGIGGVSGWGGDAFDLADVGLASARFVRLTDTGKVVGFTGATEGADFDSVMALNSAVISGGGVDSDGDGIPDGEENLAGLDPKKADTDGDGMDDGEELASCLDPMRYGDTTEGIDPYAILGPPSAPSSSDDGGGGGGSGGCMIASPGRGFRANALAVICFICPFLFFSVARMAAKTRLFKK